jgi:hypothetical protein
MFKPISRSTSVLAFVLVSATLACGLFADAPDVPQMTYVGSALWTKAHDLKFRDHLAFCAFGNGLVILDLADIKKPARLSYLYLGGGFGIDVKDGLAFVASGTKGLNIVDVMDAKAPVLKGSLQTGGEARDVIVSGDRAFVAAGPAGVLTVDISDPAAPKLAATVTGNGEASSLALRGDRLFVADGSAGIEVIDLKSLARPEKVGALAFEGTAEGIALSGDVAYVADGASGLRVVDIHDASSPRLAATLAASGYCRSVSAEGTLLCVGSLYDGGYQVYDISKPASPVLLSTNKYTMYNESWRVVLHGGRAAVIDYFSGIFFADLTAPAQPTIAGTYFTPSSIVAAAVYGRFVLAVGELSGLQVLDIGYPPRPLSKGTTEIFRGVQGLAVGGDHAYVTDRWSVRVFDLKKLTSPAFVKSLRVPSGVPRTIVVRWKTAYLTADLGGLYVISLTDPADPKIVGQFKYSGFAYGLAVDRDYAYLAHSDMGLQILDIRNPAVPVKVGSLKLRGEPYGVAVQGHYAYVASGPEGLVVVDISRPEKPNVVSTFPVEDFANAVAVSGGWAYVSDGKAGVKKVDISNPAALKLEAAFDTPGESQGVVFCGSLLFVPDSDSLIILK